MRKFLSVKPLPNTAVNSLNRVLMSCVLYSARISPSCSSSTMRLPICQYESSIEEKKDDSFGFGLYMIIMLVSTARAGKDRIDAPRVFQNTLRAGIGGYCAQRVLTKAKSTYVAVSASL